MRLSVVAAVSACSCAGVRFAMCPAMLAMQTAAVPSTTTSRNALST